MQEKYHKIWRGLFKVKKKLSDVLYAVACDSRGKTTIIQCDRMMKSNVQVLSKETNTGIYDEDDSHVGNPRYLVPPKVFDAQYVI